MVSRDTFQTKYNWLYRGSKPLSIICEKLTFIFQYWNGFNLWLYEWLTHQSMNVKLLIIPSCEYLNLIEARLINPNKIRFITLIWCEFKDAGVKVHNVLRASLRSNIAKNLWIVISFRYKLHILKVKFKRFWIRNTKFFLWYFITSIGIEF